MPSRPKTTLQADDLLRDCPVDQVSTYLPTPLDKRLALLVDKLNELGQRTSRRELIAALILDCPEHDEELWEVVRHFRRASVEEAVVDGSDPAFFLTPWKKRKGRPRK